MPRRQKNIVKSTTVTIKRYVKMWRKNETGDTQKWRTAEAPTENKFKA